MPQTEAPPASGATGTMSQDSPLLIELQEKFLSLGPEAKELIRDKIKNCHENIGRIPRKEWEAKLCGIAEDIRYAAQIAGKTKRKHMEDGATARLNSASDSLLLTATVEPAVVTDIEEVDCCVICRKVRTQLVDGHWDFVDAKETAKVLDS